MQRALAALARVTICGAVRFVDGPHRPAVTADDVSQVGGVSNPAVVFGCSHRHVNGPNLTGNWGGGMRGKQPAGATPPLMTAQEG